MKKINKIINIASIFVLIGSFLCSNFTYAVEALRVPVGIKKARSGMAMQGTEINYRSRRNDFYIQKEYTAVYKTIDIARKLIEQNKSLEAVGLLEELLTDLNLAQEKQDLTYLMVKWNDKVQQEWEADLRTEDIPRAIQDVETLIHSATDLIIPSTLLLDNDTISLTEALKLLTMHDKSHKRTFLARTILKLAQTISGNCKAMTSASAWHRLDNIALIPDSGVRCFRLGRKMQDKRIRKINQYRYSYPSEFIFWNGVSERRLFDSQGFKRHMDINLLDYLWGRPARDIVKAANIKDDSDWTAKEVSGFVVEELLEAYKILNKTGKVWNLSDLLKELKKNRRGIFINDEVVLDRGLRWLEMKGFPVLRAKDRWFVSGVARRVFFTIKESAEHRGNTSQRAIAVRIRLAMRIRGLRWEDISMLTKGILTSQELFTFTLNLEKGKANTGERMDRALEILSRIVGKESIWLRTGFSRAEWEVNVFKQLPRSKIGKRIKTLRQLEGISQETLARRLHWKVNHIKRLESLEHKMPIQEYQLVQNQKDWLNLAHGLGFKHAFFILTGFDKEEMLKRLPQGIRIRMCRLNKGMTQPELAKRFGVSTTSIVGWERKTMPGKMFRKDLADLFGVTIEQLFNQKKKSNSTELLYIYANVRYAL